MKVKSSKKEETHEAKSSADRDSGEGAGKDLSRGSDGAARAAGGRSGGSCRRTDAADGAFVAESDLPRIRREGIGFVFQGFNLFPTLTAAENVALALDLRGIRGGAAKTRGEELLAEVGLAEKARSFPADLSGGQKQRVAIARALAGDPPILLADEPTAALGSTSGRTVIELLQRLARVHGRAVVMVTHDPRVLSFGDRIIHLEDGRIVGEEKNAMKAIETSSFLEVQSAAPAMARELLI